MTAGLLPPVEHLAEQLRQLYQRYGYKQYKFSQFEEYDLYAGNRRFLASPQILSFSDTSGRLMALKPDITLSIIKNTRDDDRTRKVWYTENVYRVPPGGGGFQEIPQTGLELLGTVDLVALSEVLMLAACSLQAMGRRTVLQVSHMGILTGVLETLSLPPEETEEALRAFEAKNTHDLGEICRRNHLAGAEASLLETLCRLAGPAEETVERLLALPLPPGARAAGEELQRVTALLALYGSFPVQLDLSLLNDRDYYNGVLFQGYVDGAAAPVLSGGQYDSLLQRMGKKGGAVGFAVYLNDLERLLEQPPGPDVDTLLVYSPKDDPAAVIAAVQRETALGRTVRVQPEGQTAVTYSRCVDTAGRERK